MSDDVQSDQGSTVFGDVPVLVTVTVGRATPTIDDLLGMSEATIITLDRALDDPVELFVGDKLIARGVLEEVGESGSGQIGVRITEVVQQKASA